MVQTVHYVIADLGRRVQRTSIYRQTATANHSLLCVQAAVSYPISVLRIQVNASTLRRFSLRSEPFTFVRMGI